MVRVFVHGAMDHQINPSLWLEQEIAQWVLHEGIVLMTIMFFFINYLIGWVFSRLLELLFY